MSGAGKSKRILVTGGAGFIGATLVRMLLNRGHEAVILDSASASGARYLAELPVEYVEGDILDTPLLERVIPAVGGVVHLAAQTGVPDSLADPRRDCELNVVGTLNLLESCRRTEQDIPIVFASSNAPLGRQVPPATEDKAPLPISPYGASKLAGEAYCLAYHGSWGLATVVLRFANVYGPYSTHKGSVVARFYSELLSRGRITIDGDGLQTRDFLYVDDLCRAIMLALETDAHGEVFQIATGVETTILELTELVLKVSGREAVVEHGPPRGGDIRKSYSVVQKARDILGWSPEVELRAGLERTWKWFTSDVAM